MKNRRRLRNRPKSEDREILAVLLTQRRYDSTGKRLQGYSMQEIEQMSQDERAKVKRANSLPSMLLPHAPVGYKTDRITFCPCEACTQAIQAWRQRTGMI